MLGHIVALFNHLKKFQTISQSSYTILYSHLSPRYLHGLLPHHLSVSAQITLRDFPWLPYLISTFLLLSVLLSCFLCLHSLSQHLTCYIFKYWFIFCLPSLNVTLIRAGLFSVFVFSILQSQILWRLSDI